MYCKDNRPFRLSNLFSRYRSRDDPQEVSSHDLYWENKIDQRKRFINATEKLGKIDELALHLVFFIQIRQLKEKAFPLVMRDAFLLP